jgi:trk system potassium uptake protein TrkH
MVFGGSIFVWLVEPYSAKPWLTSGERLFHSFFMIISAKTAGFDLGVVDTISNFTVFFVIITMWIGGSPGSTAGGIKNTTTGVLIIAFINYMKGNDNIHFSGRRIHPSSVQKAQMTFLSAILIAMLGIALVSFFEPNMHFQNIVFEVISAISTTGLTLSTTPYLNSASKYVILFAMYIGRVGVLTFLFAFFKDREPLKYEYPDEKVAIG